MYSELKAKGLEARLIAFRESADLVRRTVKERGYVVPSLLDANGFVLERLWSCRDTLRALSDMAAYPKAIRLALRGVGLLAQIPWLSPRRWWSGSRPGASLATAGSIAFAARKPE